MTITARRTTLNPTGRSKQSPKVSPPKDRTPRNDTSANTDHTNAAIAGMQAATSTALTISHILTVGGII